MCIESRYLDIDTDIQNINYIPTYLPNYIYSPIYQPITHQIRVEQHNTTQQNSREIEK